jgi:hypothetical protein
VTFALQPRRRSACRPPCSPAKPAHRQHCRSSSTPGQMGDKAASPSPAVSSAKSRRLDALHRRLGGKRAGEAQHPGKQTSICGGAPAAEHHAFLCQGLPPAEEMCAQCWKCAAFAGSQAVHRLGFQTRGTERAVQWQRRHLAGRSQPNFLMTCWTMCASTPPFPGGCRYTSCVLLSREP